MGEQKSPSAFGFDRYDKGRLERTLNKVSDKRTFLRLQAVLLMTQGMHMEAVAKIVGKTSRVIYYWVQAYVKSHQPKALFDAPRSGRPLCAQQLTDQRILKELKRNPLHLGYHTTVWTVALLAAHLNSCYSNNIHPRTLRRRMKAMGLRFKRPRYIYEEKDLHRAQKKGR